MKNISLLTLLLLALPMLAVNGWAQCPDGRPPPCRDGSPPKPRCMIGGTILVRCGQPGCDVAVDDKEAGVTDSGGELSIAIREGKHAVEITKRGYDRATLFVQVLCGKTKEVGVVLIARLVPLRLRTSPPNCDVYVGQELRGRSDANGILMLEAKLGSLLIEARKEGYLSVNKSIAVTGGEVGPEVVLTLTPLPASLKVITNLRGARVRLNDRPETKPADEAFSVEPGKYQVTVEAVGHETLLIEISLQPGERMEKAVNLKAKPPEELLTEAKLRLQSKDYDVVLQLCQYLFDSNPQDPKAHKFAGLALLGGKDKNYQAIKSHFETALAANESVPLLVRRHAGEDFRPSKPHTNCEGEIKLWKGKVEFHGKQVNGEDFTALYDAIQVLGIQLVKGQVAYLGTKIAIGKGKKRDYKFFSPTDELSQAGRGYLEMIQSLLRQH